MTKPKPLRSVEVEATDDGSGVLWSLKTLGGEHFKFLFPSANLGGLIEQFLRLAVRPKISKHAKPPPRLATGQIAKARPLPTTAIGSFVVPLSGKVGFECELPGGIRFVFQLHPDEALQFAERLQAAVQEAAQKRASDTRH